MPYIKNSRKRELADGAPVEAAGDLTYLLTLALIGDERDQAEAFTKAVARYVKAHEGSMRYEQYAIILGACASAQHEHPRRLGARGLPRAVALGRFAAHYYRDVIAPYEDGKIAENGDVYPE